MAMMKHEFTRDIIAAAAMLVVIMIGAWIVEVWL